VPIEVSIVNSRISSAGERRWTGRNGAARCDLVMQARDARKRGIASWPFVAATLLHGTIGVLAYCVRRTFA
jgi:hypothetical protein